MPVEHEWYEIAEIAPGCVALGEPRYAQRNWSFLFLGAERALLFDTGSFYGEMAPVIHALNDRPLTVLPSHMHYDHLGNIHGFDRIALPDLEVLRSCAEGGVMTPTDTLFLGASEGREPPSFTIAEWLEIGTRIDLGGLTLALWHTPGHSPDSVSLWWEETGMLFAADFLYPGSLYAQTPGASLADYLTTARHLRERVPPGSVIWGAHGEESAPRLPPRQTGAALTALCDRLEALRRDPPEIGETPAEIAVTDRHKLLISREALTGFA